jgi:transcriptional regulator with GAF, ATPase, and Fis domain
VNPVPPASAALEAALWREVGQHLELEQSARRLATILAAHVPIEALVLRRVERDPLRLTTVALGSTREDGAGPSAARSDCPPELASELERWLGDRRVTPVADTALAHVIAPPGVEQPLHAGPLFANNAPIGAALFVPAPGRMLDASQLRGLAAALDPLAIALENDQRLHELARMRDALLADRAALLSRLGREDISEVVIGEQQGLRGVMQRVEQVAPTDAPVLILGETGSGKEVIARAVHARSRRAKGPVVRVNCGAIPSELVDSELFGHERGSFTGAVNQRRGWFERADGGTLFLDEVAELPPAAQVRLLRVLQDGTLERVGGHQPITVDVRIVAATHRNLEAMVAEGAFREDLWYRISVIPLRLLPLRERRQDVAALAAHFAHRAGVRLGGSGLAPSAADIELLEGYDWPGNVRELAAVIERAAILGNAKRLEIATALGASSARKTEPPKAAVALPANAPIGTLDEATIAHIERALAATEGRIEGRFGAARILGINPHTLRARMRKLGIDWSRFRKDGAA